MYLEHEEAKRAHTKKGRMVAKEGKEVRGMRAEDKEEDVKNGEKSRRRREGENEDQDNLPSSISKQQMNLMLYSFLNQSTESELIIYESRCSF